MIRGLFAWSALSLGLASCSCQPTEPPLPPSPLADADETIDLGELQLDAAQPKRLGTLDLVRGRRYGIACRCTWTDEALPAPNVLSLFLLQERSNQRPWSIGSATLRRMSQRSSGQPVVYEGVIKTINRSGTATMQLSAGKVVMMQREVRISP